MCLERKSGSGTSEEEGKKEESRKDGERKSAFMKIGKEKMVILGLMPQPT